VAATNRDSTERKPTSSHDGKPKQVIVPNPKCKQNARANSKSRKVDRTSDTVEDVTVNSGKTRPKRRCRRLVHYEESVDSGDQSASPEESNDESSEQETVSAAGKITTKRRSDEVAQASQTAAAKRSVVVT